MKTRKKLILWIMLGVVVLCLIVSTVLIGQQLRQDSLDRALIGAVKKVDAPTVLYLLGQGANANARDEAGPETIWQVLTSLLSRFRHRAGSKAVSHGSSALQLLMNDVRRFDWHYTARFDAIEATLILHRASIDVLGTYGQTPLDEAVASHLHQTLSLLIARGANVNAKNKEGWAPLMWADAYSAKLLIQHGADVNARDRHGKTALFYPYRVDRARVLIEHGANVNLTDDKGISLLYHVQTEGHYVGQAAIIQLLKQHGARLNNKDKRWIAIDQKYVREWGYPVPH